MINKAATFHIPFNAEILSHKWDDECVIYNTVTGETHLLEITAASILLAIAENPINFTQIMELLKSQCNDSDEQELETYLIKSLEQFQNMDLIKTTME